MVCHQENATYQVFEKDPVKYVNYEDAVYKALVDAQGMFLARLSPCLQYLSPLRLRLFAKLSSTLLYCRRGRS
eukprot:SAG31_NODE_505_length_14757_cov_20.172943_10_plen_73_part_00